jgi:hypothetical protein
MRYGGNGTAPMVTWIFRFHWDQRTQSEPDAVYQQCVNEILEEAKYITDDGDVFQDITAD